MSDRYQQFLDKLEPSEREQVESAVERALAVWPYGSDCKALGGNLWEIRIRLPTRIVRALFGKAPHGLVPLDGLVKKDRGRHSHSIKQARKALTQLVSEAEGRRPR